MARLFISHSSADNEEAKAFADWLTHNGWEDYFLDFHHTKGLNPGERWQEALKAAADRCEAVVFLISPAWRDSRWCLAEFLLAKQMGKAIFGVLVKPTPLDTLPSEMTAEWQLADWTKDREDGQARLKTGLERAGLDPSTFPWPPPGDPDRAPYRGLKPLDEADAAILFGREADIVRALDTLRQIRDRGDARLLVILGASGAGKSSVLRAGLWPRLKRDTRHFLPLPILRPGRAPLTGETGLAACLEQALAKAGRPEARGQIAADIRVRRTEAVRERLVKLQQSALTAPQEDAVPPTLLIALDQAEELFLAGESREAEIVLSALAPLLAPPPEGDEAAGAAARRLLIGVATIRSDTFQSLQQSASLAGVKRTPFDLPPILSGAYRSIIEGPAKRASDAGNKLVIEPALTERLLKETTGADALPVLAFTLERLFVQYGSDGDLRLDEYEALGGTSGSIEAAVAEAMQSVPGGATLETVRAAFFPWLVRIDTAEDAPLRRLARLDEFPAKVRPVIDAFITQRLLRTSSADTGDGEETVIEVAHEALLRQWPTLSAWLVEERAALRLISDVQAAALEYDKRESQGERRDLWLIHRGGRLDHAEAALQAPQYQAVLGASGRDYLAACRALQDRLHTEEREQLEAEKARLAEIASLQTRRARSQRRGLVVNLVFLAIVATSLSGAVLGFKQLRVEQSRNLVSAALTAETDGMPDRALRLAILASEGDALRPPSPDAAPAAAEIAFRTPWRATLVGHQGALSVAAFSPDGKSIITASSDNTARIWRKAEDGTWDSTALEGHEGPVTSAAFSPDGTHIVTTSWDEAARVWREAEDGTWDSTPLVGHWLSVGSAAFSSDGTRIVTTSRDDIARVWRKAEDGTWDSTALEGHEGPVTSAAFSPDGTRIVTTSRDDTARVWREASNGNWTSTPLDGHHVSVRSAAFSPDGTRIVTTSRDDVARVWREAEDGTWDNMALEGHRGTVKSATFSPDGTRIVTASIDRTARVWRQAEDGTWDSTLLEGHTSRVTSAAFSPDGTSIVTASEDMTARVWREAAYGTWNSTALEGHEGPVHSAAYSPDGTRIVTASEDMTARVWHESANGSRDSTPLEGHTSWVTSAAFSPDRTSIVTASWDKTARVWRKAEDGTWNSRPLKGHRWLVNSAVFSQDSTRIVTASNDGTARAWREAAEGSWDSTPLEGHQSGVKSATFSPDGTRIVTASIDRTARVWRQAEDGTWDSTALVGHEGPVHSAAYSPDGTRIVTASGDKTARVWRKAAEGSWDSTPLEGHKLVVWSAAFSPDGKSIVTASEDTTAQVWRQAEDGTWDSTALEGHDDTVTSAAFSPDGTRIVTASWDKTARVWRKSMDGTWSGTLLEGHGDKVTSAAFSPDGTRIVTASHDGTARVWDVSLLAGDDDWAASDQRSRAAAICLDRMSRTSVLVEDEETGETRRVFPSRIVTKEDAAAFPVLRDRIGYDVCSKHLDPPPWWHAFAFWR